MLRLVGTAKDGRVVLDKIDSANFGSVPLSVDIGAACVLTS